MKPIVTLLVVLGLGASAAPAAAQQFTFSFVPAVVAQASRRQIVPIKLQAALEAQDRASDDLDALFAGKPRPKSLDADLAAVSDYEIALRDSVAAADLGADEKSPLLARWRQGQRRFVGGAERYARLLDAQGARPDSAARRRVVEARRGAADVETALGS
jgi:hypothetical protein